MYVAILKLDQYIQVLVMSGLSKCMRTFGDMDIGYRHELYIVNSVHTQTSIQWALLSSFRGIKRPERVAGHSYVVPRL
jgi:hypothetical protein